MDTHSCEGREGTFECQEEGCTLKFYNKLMLEKHVQSCYLFKNCPKLSQIMKSSQQCRFWTDPELVAP